MSTTPIIKMDTKKFETALATLGAEASTLIVQDAGTCLEAKQRQQSVRYYLKDVHSAFDPFVNMAKRNYDDAKTERSKWVDPGEALDESLSLKVKDYERKERERALREQDEINRQKREREAREADEQRKVAEAEADRLRKIREKEIEEARKAGELTKREAEKAKKLEAEIAEKAKEQAAKNAEAEKANFQAVTLKPNIPAVAGVPSRRNWKFRVLDATRIPREYLMPNEMKIGADVRFWKDKAKAESTIPGIEAYEE